MVKRSLYQPFVRPPGQPLRRHLRTMEYRVISADVLPPRRAKALRPQVQKLVNRQHPCDFAQEHRGSLAQGAGNPAENTQCHDQPRHGPMLRLVFAEAEDLAGLAGVAVAITTVSALNEGGINMGGGR